jgi:FAD/FMN-containing dehydrogenase
VTFVPSTAAELQDAIAQAGAQRRPISSVDMSRLNRIIEHNPEDLTCTVECGCTLAALQAALTAKGQWLPVNPPDPDQLTIRDVIEGNLTGPRRYGFGTLRDYLLGIEVILGDGSRVRSGGRVVKNVAGYDLHKLFIGSRGTLGLPVVATFKLLPHLPDPVARIVTGLSLPDAVRRAQVARENLPGLIALDLCRLNADAGPTADLFIELAGDSTRQIERAESLGITGEAASDWNDAFWNNCSRCKASFSVLPSNLSSALGSLVNRRFVARAGSGIIYHEGPPVVAPRHAPNALVQRLKDTFDPFGVLAPLTVLSGAEPLPVTT